MNVVPCLGEQAIWKIVTGSPNEAVFWKVWGPHRSPKDSEPVYQVGFALPNFHERVFSHSMSTGRETRLFLCFSITRVLIPNAIKPEIEGVAIGEVKQVDVV
jgi:hypothetical protein